MATQSLGHISDQDLIKYYQDELQQRCARFFYNRAGCLQSFYKDVFDDRLECIALINMPACGAYAEVTPTNCMIWREARFLLGSDQTEHIWLTDTWDFLHELVRDRMDKVQLVKMAELNEIARIRIMDCREVFVTSEVEFTRLLGLGRRARAIRFAEAKLAKLDQIFEEILAGYPSCAALR